MSSDSLIPLPKIDGSDSLFDVSGDALYRKKDSCAIFRGNRSDYLITQVSDDHYRVMDNRYGFENQVFDCREVEFFEFDDMYINAPSAYQGETLEFEFEVQAFKEIEFHQTIEGGNGKDYLEGSAGNDWIDAGNGKDWLDGKGGDDHLIGGNGKDEITGGGGNDQLEGGAGKDTAFFSGNFSDYRIEKDSEGRLIIEDGRPDSPDGRDVVSTVEILAFADGEIDVDDLVFVDPGSSVTVSDQPIRETIEDGGTIFEGDLNSDGMVVATIEELNDFNFELTDESGNRVNDARFELKDGEIKVREGAVFDFETEPEVTIHVTAESKHGQKFTEEVTFTIGDFEGYYIDSNEDDTVNSTIEGTSEEDVIIAGDGDDTVDGGEGSDQIVIGDQTLNTGNHISDSGSTGVDTLVLSGADGKSFEIQQDFSATSSGIEVIDGTNVDGEVIRTLGGAANFDFTDIELKGVDAIRGRAKEDDHITGSRGDDYIIGKSGNDVLYGGAGNDTIDTGNGDDYVDGGEGSDTIFLDDISTEVGKTIVDSGSEGIDQVILSGDDADTFEIQNNFSADSGIEIIDGSNMDGEVIRTIDGAAQFDFTGVEMIEVDEIHGTRHDDSITGSAGNDTFRLGAGNDTLDGGDGLNDELILSGRIDEYSITQSGRTFTINGPDEVKTVQNVESIRFADGSINLQNILTNGHAPVLEVGIIATAFGENDINLDDLSLYSIAPQTVGGELSYGKDIGPTGSDSGGGNGPEGVIYTDTEIGPGFFRYTFNGEGGVDFSNSLGSYLNFANGQIENVSRQNTPTTSDVNLVATNGDTVSVELNYGTYGQEYSKFGEVFQYSIALKGETFDISDEKLASVLENLEYVDVRVETNYGVTGAESFLTQPDPSYGLLVAIDADMIQATDPLDGPDELVFSVDGVQNGHFVYLVNPDVTINSFTQLDIDEGKVGFQSTNSSETPGFNITVTDSVGDSDSAGLLFESTVTGYTGPLEFLSDEDELSSIVTESGMVIDLDADGGSFDFESAPVVEAPPLPFDEFDTLSL